MIKKKKNSVFRQGNGWGRDKPEHLDASMGPSPWYAPGDKNLCLCVCAHTWKLTYVNKERHPNKSGNLRA